MSRALKLAQYALGTTSPNPAVGAVLVKGDRIIGEGYTQPPGRAHAEIIALEAAGDEAKGSSLYSTLEPCNIYGRTPPCTEAIIAAGVSTVCYAVLDPNPNVQGKGIRQLNEAGIDTYHQTVKGASELYEAFSKHINTGLPFVTAKFAMSLDGKIATRTGNSKWITGESARKFVHQLRRASDAIIVGVNTVILDDPLLTTRDLSGNPLPNQPLRVIVDSKGRTPTNSRCLNTPGSTVVAMSAENSTNRKALQQVGAEVLYQSHGRPQVDLLELLRYLGARGIVSALVEGGGGLLGSLFDDNLVDKVCAFVAPTIIGGRNAPSPVQGQGARTLSQATCLERIRIQQVGNDILVQGYPG
ncbi:bifunctional diaminohydroxyphosphoribosylaminopyrimidine deaminase/5-amino-6-(5-phosphoribosylamino)uracil reductase RibD [SAR202 cluster bacterium AD-804-J14_MRT_500m]|nr:bifunctional diaminohydroxyphosphoribosylaminopyrimidine deaminase/5-amino-6-(5-phosphoribosylamino)uracil reductase RibD [SAR202 cluster bacterium AD-804-J14_MRT_500m]